MSERGCGKVPVASWGSGIEREESGLCIISKKPRTHVRIHSGATAYETVGCMISSYNARFSVVSKRHHWEGNVKSLGDMGSLFEMLMLARGRCNGSRGERD